MNFNNLYHENTNSESDWRNILEPEYTNNVCRFLLFCNLCSLFSRQGYEFMANKFN